MDFRQSLPPLLKGVEDADELEEQLAAVVVHVGDIEYGSHPCIFAWECAYSFDVKYLGLVADFGGQADVVCVTFLV